MKRVLVLATVMVGLFISAFAQRTLPKEVKKAEIAKHKAEKKEDKREKEAVKNSRKASKEVAKEIQHSSGIKKDGTPDMRIAANKRKVEEEARLNRERATRERERQLREATARQRNQSPVSPRIKPQPVNRSADRVVSTDSKGRTIYEGPRGGRYYINANGNKEYIKQ